jgi:hypothetical protein
VVSSVYSFSFSWLNVKTCRIAISCLLRVTFVPLTRHTRAIFLNKVKVKVVSLHTKKAQRTTALEGSGWSASRSGRFTPEKRPGTHFTGPQGLSRRVRKISPPTEIRAPDRPARSESPHRLPYLVAIPK